MVACRNDDSTRNRKSVQATFVKNLLCQNSPFPLTIEGGAATMEVSFSGYGAKRSVRIHAADPGAVPGASTLPLPAKRQRNGGGEIASTRTIKGALGQARRILQAFRPLRVCLPQRVGAFCGHRRRTHHRRTGIRCFGVHRSGIKISSEKRSCFFFFDRSYGGSCLFFQRASSLLLCLSTRGGRAYFVGERLLRLRPWRCRGNRLPLLRLWVWVKARHAVYVVSRRLSDGSSSTS